MVNFFKKGKKTWALSLFLATFLLTAAQPAYALPLIGDFLNYTQSAMSGLADLGGWIFAVFTILFVGLGLSRAAVLLAGALMEWSLKLPIVLQNNEVVKAGWDFTLGLTNLFLVLIFVGIALAFILNQGTYGLKKALPRLFGVALLVNFSLLFVSIFADTAVIFQNAILESAGMGNGEGLVSNIIELTTQSTKDYIFRLITLGSGSAILLAIPGVDVLTMGGRIALFFAFTPQLVNAFFLILFNIILFLIFAFYFVLFMSRIVVFWILAILSPLAFLAFILPTTKKYFDQWLKTLLSWTFFGAAALFLLVVGLQLITTVISGWLGIGGSGAFYPFSPTEYASIGKYFVYYSIVCVYLILVLFASKRLAPKGTEIVWNYGGAILNRSGKWTGERAGLLAKKAGIGLKEKRQRAAERIAAKMEAEKRSIKLGERIRTGVWSRRPTPEKVLDIGLRAELEAKKGKESLLAAEKERVLRGAPKDPEDRRNYLRTELLREESKGPLRKLDKIAAILDIIAKEGKIGKVEERFITDAVKRGVDPDKILERRPDLAPKLGKSIAETMAKINPENLRKKTQKEAYQNPEVFLNVMKDEAKFNELTFRGSAELKKIIKESFKKNAASLHPKNIPAGKERNNYKNRLKRMFKTDSRWQV